MILAFLFLLFGSDQFHPDHIYREVLEDHYSAPIDLHTKRFHLIGKGSQFFAFESEDHTTVLKIFKARHYLSKIPKRLHLFFSQELRKKSEARWKKKFISTCRCYQLAFEHFREETALIALHFNKTGGDKYWVTLVDGKKKYVVDLNEIPFVLQKKATLLPAYLKQLPVQEQKKAIEKVRRLFERRIGQKITDRRQSLRINYGFVGEEAVQIDPGKIYHDENLDTMVETERLNLRVDNWVRKYFPSLQLF